MKMQKEWEMIEESIETRLLSHKQERLARIPRDKDKQLFNLSMALLNSKARLASYKDGLHIEILLIRKQVEIDMAFNRLFPEYEDSFFKGKKQSMMLLAYETQMQIYKSELKKLGHILGQ